MTRGPVPRTGPAGDARGEELTQAVRAVHAIMAAAIGDARGVAGMLRELAAVARASHGMREPGGRGSVALGQQLEGAEQVQLLRLAALPAIETHDMGLKLAGLVGELLRRSDDTSHALLPLCASLLADAVTLGQGSITLAPAASSGAGEGGK